MACSKYHFMYIILLCVSLLDESIHKIFNHLWRSLPTRNTSWSRARQIDFLSTSPRAGNHQETASPTNKSASPTFFTSMIKLKTIVILNQQIDRHHQCISVLNITRFVIHWIFSNISTKFRLELTVRNYKQVRLKMVIFSIVKWNLLLANCT